jgi:hypothetical protein
MGNTPGVEEQAARSSHKRPFARVVETECEPLSQMVYDQLQILLVDVVPADSETGFCSQYSQNLHHINQRLLASFGECAEHRRLS